MQKLEGDPKETRSVLLVNTPRTETSEDSRWVKQLSDVLQKQDLKPVPISAEELMQKLQAGQYRGVIIDSLVKNPEGIIRQARKISRLPIIYASWTHSVEQVRALCEAGATGVIQKDLCLPVIARNLRGTILP